MSGAAVEPVPRSREPGWEGFSALYRALFPPAEREPVELVRRRVDSGRYRLAVLRSGGEVVGFALVDRVPEPAYGLLCYLGVAEAHRGAGLGRRLGEDAVASHRWEGDGVLLVEARDERAAALYRQCGFRVLALGYRSPLYGSAVGSIPMTLLAAGGRETVPGDYMRRVVEHLYTDGYGLERDDPRLRAQLERIPEMVTTC